jgi:hypothetical protein
MRIPRVSTLVEVGGAVVMSELMISFPGHYFAATCASHRASVVCLHRPIVGRQLHGLELHPQTNSA